MIESAPRPPPHHPIHCPPAQTMRSEGCLSTWDFIREPCKHADWHGGGYSTNGTYIEGKLVDGSCVALPGQTISFGAQLPVCQFHASLTTHSNSMPSTDCVPIGAARGSVLTQGH